MKFKLLFLILFSALFQITEAQRYAKKHFTCFDYNVDIDEQIFNSISGLESHIQIRTEGKQRKAEALLIHNFYNKLTKLLSDSLEIFILAPNSLTDKAKYTIYGYPDITIQKAIRLSDTKYFLRIDVSLINDIYDNEGKRLPESSFKPQLKVKAEIYSKEGFNPIQYAEADVKAPKSFILKPSFIAGLEFADNSKQPEKGEISLKSMIDEASMQILNGIKNTKPKKP